MKQGPLNGRRKCVFDAPQTFIKWFAQFGKSKRLLGHSFDSLSVFQYFRIDFANFSFRSTRTLGIAPPLPPPIHTPLTRKVLVARSKSQYSRAWNCSMNGNFKGATWARPANYLRSSLTSFACTNSARHSNFNHNN